MSFAISASTSENSKEINTLSPNSPDGDKIHGPDSLNNFHHSSSGAISKPPSPNNCTGEADISTVISEVPSFFNSSTKDTESVMVGSIIRTRDKSFSEGLDG